MANVTLTQGIDVTRLDQLVLDLGVRVCVYKSTLCPNLTSLESDDHDINCTVCSKRMVDFAPVSTMALFQQQQLNEFFKVQGTHHQDEIMVTFLSGMSISPMARIDLVDFQQDFFELVQRRENSDTDILKYQAKCVTGVFTVSNNVKEEFHFGTDFSIDPNGCIQWDSNHRPDDRQIYTIHYSHTPTYRATKAIHRDRYSQMNQRNQNVDHKIVADGRTFIKLPETWVISRISLPDRYDHMGNKIGQNPYYDPNEETP